MSQQDFNITQADADTGVTVRAAINAALQALASTSSGAVEPATMYAYQMWADTTSGKLKMRNGANSGWITLLDLATSITATNTEINYVDGVTSAIQTQLDSKVSETIALGERSVSVGTSVTAFLASIALNAQDNDLGIGSSIQLDDAGYMTLAAATKINISGALNKEFFDTAPANASDTGTTGDIRITTTYIYVCTATNTWKRTALTTW